MCSITTSSLVQFIKKQLELYFTDFHEANLKKKILEMTSTVERMIPEIIRTDPRQKDKFDEWNQIPSILESSLCQLEELRKESVDIKTDAIDDIIFRLKAVLSDRETLFLSKNIGMTDWNKNKAYLKSKICLLENTVSNQTLTSKEVIEFLDLMPLNQCTSELGYYKEIMRGINDEGKTFTKIFYLLEENEISFFHKLDTTETWTWLGTNPLSLFIIENGQLVEHVLNESHESIVIPNQTWFSATVRNDDRHNLVKDDIPFALVTCYCVPAFTISCYHDDITTDENASILLVNEYKKADSEMQNNIIKLIAHPHQVEFKKKVS